MIKETFVWRKGVQIRKGNQRKREKGAYDKKDNMEGTDQTK
jgi:hypothetical protein